MGFLKRKKDLSDLTVSNMKNEEKDRHTAELLSERESSVYRIEEILFEIAEESGNKRLKAKRKRRF